MHAMQVVALVGCVFVLLGWLLWFLVRRWNRTRAILQAATPMPIPMVNVWDAVWIRGQARCSQPLHVPHFGHGCLHFSYTLEEEVTRTKTDSNGKTVTETTWETRKTEAEQRPFVVCQNDA